MSAEEGSTQPPAAGNEKAQAPKPAATFSSFINKNTTGKKFAPKAARRRPGAAPAAAAPKPAATETPTPNDEAQTTVSEPKPPIAPSEPAPAVQLPTPAATQETALHNATETTPSLPAAETSAPVPTTLPEPASTDGTPLHTPAPASTEKEKSPVAEPSTIQITHAVQDEVDTARPAKRRRMDPSAPTVTADPDNVTKPSVPDTPSQSISTELEAPPPLHQETTTTSHDVRASLSVDNTQSTAGAEQAVTDETEAPRPRKRRVLPWVAINRPQEEEVAPAQAKKTRKPPKSLGKKQTAPPEETDVAGQQAGPDGSEAQPAKKKLNAKARGKRQADAPELEDGVEGPAPAKRTRRPRKAKNQEPTNGVEADEEAVEQQDGEEPAVRRKPRQPRRKKRAAVEGEKGAEDGTQPKRKGRPPRELTPSDAEDNEIDPEVTFMDSLASRNIRVGKLSAREKAMREIDWDAVRERRRAEDSRIISTKEMREKADQLQLAEPPQDEGPRMRLGANGEIELVHESTTLNREAAADREIAEYEVHEEQDLTSRITSRSFLKNNKRFPNEFLLPGQGKRWTADDTEHFYQGLRNFGTDFQMISHMFPGYSRRSIKLKFTREERENPDLVREALLGQSQLASHWNDFMGVSQMDEEHFADVEKIKREMDEVAAEMREKINAAKAEADERKQRQIDAGVLDADGNEIVEQGKENAMGKKKRKGKDKQVTFQEEKGVENLGPIDADENWGKE